MSLLKWAPQVLPFQISVTFFYKYFEKFEFSFKNFHLMLISLNFLKVDKEKLPANMLSITLLEILNTFWQNQKAFRISIFYWE